MTEVEATLFLELDMAILAPADDSVFITSDNPCTWFDSEACKRPRRFRQPALVYTSTEIRLPLSPRCMLILNQRGINGYAKIGKELVDDMNRITRSYCYEVFVHQEKEVNPNWLLRK